MSCKKTKKLVIIGDSAFAEVAYEYFQYDSEYEVVAFAVEQEFLKRDCLFDLPIVPLENLSALFPADQYSVFVAIVYSQLNRLRTRLVEWAKANFYPLASYVSSKAFVWRNVQIGEHCFIFEDNTVQPFVNIGSNVILWSGNHIGHHSSVEDNCFIASHVVISGFCTIGKNCFLGVNATIGNNVDIAEDNWIGPGVMLTKSTERGQLFGLSPVEASKVSTHRFFKVKEQESI